MQIKLLQLKSLEAPLAKLMEQKVPVKTSYRLAKVLKQIASELQDIEEIRQKLIREYGELNDDAQTITIKDQEKLNKFQTEFNEVLDEEVTLNYEPISIDSLGDDLSLSVSEVTILSILFTD